MSDQPRNEVARPLLGILATLGLGYTLVQFAEPLEFILTSGGRGVDLIGWVILTCTPLGYAWFWRVCFAANPRQSDRAIFSIAVAAPLAGGACVPIAAPQDHEIFMLWILLTGVWFLNLLGFEKLLRTLRRVREVANEE